MNVTFDVASLRPAKGDVLLVVLVREFAIVPPAGWTQIETGLGASFLYLDAFARMVDDEEPASALFTGSDEEIQGALIVLRGGSPALLRESSSHVAFAADATPNTPAIDSAQAIDLALGVWSSIGSVTLTAPDGYSTIDAFSTSVISARSILIAYKVIGATGSAIAQPPASSSGAATGRSFVLVLRDALPATPASLLDLVPGNIGLLGKDIRPAREVPFGG